MRIIRLIRSGVILVLNKIAAAMVIAAVASSASAPAFGQASPMPIWQMTYPVLTVGERGQMILQVPASYGLANSETFSVHAISRDGRDSGYRFATVRCPPGFLPSGFGAGELVMCSMQRGVPHPAGEMIVQVTNVDAKDGETLMVDGLQAKYGGVEIATFSPWRIYGVR